jgi:phytoene dehydrogenase-like protein
LNAAASAARSGYDCVVIGAGHNGLVCAATLARGGRSVLVLEAGTHVGGAALTREFAPGFRVSAGAHLLHMVPADLLRELRLGSHGLEWAAQGMATTALGAGGASLSLTPEEAGDRLSPADARALPRAAAAGHDRLDRPSGAAADRLADTPLRQA